MLEIGNQFTNHMLRNNRIQGYPFGIGKRRNRGTFKSRKLAENLVKISLLRIQQQADFAFRGEHSLEQERDILDLLFLDMGPDTPFCWQ